MSGAPTSCPRRWQHFPVARFPFWKMDSASWCRGAWAGGRLNFVLGASTAAARCEFVFLCLPTPEQPDGSADMSYVLSAAREIGPVLSPGSIVINKSTVPIGSARAIAKALRRTDVAVVSNPEFLREGSALRDCHEPDRIVIGSYDKATGIRVASLFESVNAPIVITSPASAEAIKYASNAFLATRLSFVNSLANLCQAVGADINDVIEGMSYDPRLGFNALRPGPGWGGSCLPEEDQRPCPHMRERGLRLHSLALRYTLPTPNSRSMWWIRSRPWQAGLWPTPPWRSGGWRRARPGTGDRRHSPAMAIAESLSEAGASVRAYDPTVRQPLPGLEVCLEPYGSLPGRVGPRRADRME